MFVTLQLVGRIESLLICLQTPRRSRISEETKYANEWAWRLRRNKPIQCTAKLIIIISNTDGICLPRA